jgi:diguanylate cyclase (GGDEF)-like protein
MDLKCKKLDDLFTELVVDCEKNNLHREHLVKLLEHLYDCAHYFDITQQDFRELVLTYSDIKATKLANDALLDFQSSTENISDITKLNIEEVEKIISQERLDLTGLKTKVNSFHDEIFVELDKANKRIEELQNEIHSLEKEVNLDHLTKVFNRKTLIEDVNKLIEMNQTSSEGFAIVIIDLDDFKLINDKNGHLAGDKVLIYIAKLLKTLVRSGSKVYRFGGEEFIIVLNRAGLEEAKIVADRVVSAIAKNKLKFKSNIITVTASLGVTQFKQGDTYETLFQRADKAMYAAKSKGKSRVEIG